MKSLFSTAPVPTDKITDDPWVQRFQQLLAKTEVVLICQTKSYGNGTPLILSADIVGSEPCIYAFGDDIVFGENPTRELISIYAQTGLPVLATQQVEPNRKCLFGIVECHAENGIQYVSRMMEKPSLNDTPSCLAAFGRYLVTPDLMQTVGNLRPGRDNEVWFSDSIVTWLDNGNRACAFILRRGEWYTVGDAKSYAAAVSAATEQYLAAVSRS
jgi:UTP--glucose-1-phosphate uridylyltransferase